MHDRFGNEAFPKLSERDMHEIGKLLRRALDRIIQASISPPRG